MITDYVAMILGWVMIAAVVAFIAGCAIAVPVCLLDRALKNKDTAVAAQIRWAAASMWLVSIILIRGLLIGFVLILPAWIILRVIGF